MFLAFGVFFFLPFFYVLKVFSVYSMKWEENYASQVMVGEAMEMRRGGCAIFFVILLCASAMAISEDKRRITETFCTTEGRATSFLDINGKIVWCFFILQFPESLELLRCQWLSHANSGKNTFEDSCLNCYFNIL